jgi:hypothetical protein
MLHSQQQQQQQQQQHEQYGDQWRANTLFNLGLGFRV